ncbi:hypothetical protein A5719_17395 [Mycolicibacterium peregrinum]|uniref:Uncharacterized protein n=1 Tax=Mycolicibacterium peregrinum TaxID=43304 RepID=A0A1A0W969_MYCPR|nr:hypothetical protein A5779_21010 [Mycolicibacterium peregrinum]OBF39259.1 hypothetical protein A5719_17395 [Mycolicibacterium peregrinum]
MVISVPVGADGTAGLRGVNEGVPSRTMAQFPPSRLRVAATIRTSHRLCTDDGAHRTGPACLVCMCVRFPPAPAAER